MRKLLLILLLLLPCLAVEARTYRTDEIPNVQLADAQRYVSNPDGILAPEVVERIDSVCGALRQRGIAQVAVVAVDNIAGGDPFSFAIDLFGGWGVGRAKDNNGLGILLVKDLREIRFVTGGGLEGVLPDAICKRIQLKYMLPYFREGNYSAGMAAGLEAVGQLLSGSELDLGKPDAAEALPAWMIFAIVIGFLVVPLAVSMLVYFRRKRCPRCGAFALELSSQQALQVTKHYDLIEYTFICRKCGNIVKRRSQSMKDDGFGTGAGGGMIIGGGFGRGGGFGGGGGGGFGGGSFGGGGAGSRW